MPTEQDLEYEIALARHDLEANLGELQLVVRDKLDLRRHAQRALDVARARARELLDRKVVVVVVAAFATIIGGLWGFRRHHAR